MKLEKFGFTLFLVSDRYALNTADSGRGTIVLANNFLQRVNPMPRHCDQRKSYTKSL